MLINNRVIWKDNSSLKDLSAVLNNIFSGSSVIPFVADEDKIYIGSDLPFNHRYFKVDVVNDQASAVSVHIWDGSEWVAAVDVIDQTIDSTGAISLSKSGIISWVTDRNQSWSKEDTTENMDGSGLETLKIYKMYWVRLSFSANLKTSTAIKYVGHKFSTDEEFSGYYPDLGRTNVKASFQTGKTNWDEQAVLAAEEIIRDLRKKDLIHSGSQIFGWEEFSDCSCHKTAEIVYRAFGADYEDRREAAFDDYVNALDKVQFNSLDKDADGRVEDYEKCHPGGRLVRS